MTTLEMITRINDAIRAGDMTDLRDMENHVRDLLISEDARDTWLALIETGTEVVERNEGGL
ncbi:MAG: hypothetical protein JJU08_14575 [Rhodobacteraceae bacterium]|nr:hypothetical protein [Paracoccaceae bacterium]